MQRNNPLQDFLAQQEPETIEILRVLRGLLSLFELTERFDVEEKILRYWVPENGEGDLVSIVVHPTHVDLRFKYGALFLQDHKEPRFSKLVYWLYPLWWRLRLRIPADSYLYRISTAFVDAYAESQALLLLEGKDQYMRSASFRTFDYCYSRVRNIKMLLMEARRIGSEPSL